ncbi:hypothetical protein SDC9_66052 [bioreactor metagenome]|uniref:Uncharacterized protein n=1 Tax=bioreactor metagenome TaxID=1076179 RepID=A0A644XTS8_9ZZZZ
MAEVQFVMLLQHGRNWEGVGALFHAGPAFRALRQGVHAGGGEFRGHLRGHAARQQGVDHALGDGDSLRAGLAVLAAAAELASQFVPDRLHGGQIIACNFVRFPVERDDLLHRFRRVVPGDGEEVPVGAKVLEGQGSFGDGPAREGLHGEDGDPPFPGKGVEFLRRIGLDEVEGELDGDEQARFHVLLRHGEAVGCDADKADLPRLLCLQDRLHGASRSHDLLPVLFEGHLVELEEVDMIRVQPPEAQVDVFRGGGGVPLHGLGSEENPVSHR